MAAKAKPFKMVFKRDGVAMKGTFHASMPDAIVAAGEAHKREAPSAKGIELSYEIWNGSDMLRDRVVQKAK